ncbi:SMP-30/gluconolactonase/LRE family protein [Cohnella sp. WQ 127256]|uniref:SMP-30/gluconolactonase/LRE family protein n=1 Tax=Cohnella sp. WQ 127256 TaxID=2938790 RepID=UPI0021177264|nr:SMP-30/gluconolactonase/LRE family protein [Cohnella sp. WQ 127256]
MTNRLEVVGDVKSLLGEGPLWLPDRKQIVWVDIEAMLVNFHTPESGDHQVIPIGQRIGAIVPAEDGRMVCALEHGFYYLDLQNQNLELIIDPESDLQDNRFNDGKCDSSGRFWAGTMPKRGSVPAGSLYRLDGDGTVIQQLTEIGCSNGISWSLDDTVMYYIDTATRRIDRFNYDSVTGRISNRQPAVRIPQEQGYPDGMTIDVEGMLWVAHWGGNCISRWNPLTGECLEQVELPVSQVTSCCFGGEHLDELYITSARVGLSEEQLQMEPLAGSLFKYIPGVKGLPAQVFKSV